MSEKTLTFDNVRVNKKEFHNSKQPISLDIVNVDQIVVSHKFKHSDGGFKYFIGYKEGEIVKPLCIILPQMTGYIKYFENGGKNMSFVIKDDDVLDKYNEIWDKIKETLSIKFHSMPVYDGKYIKTKVRGFSGVTVACITIDSITRMEKKKYPQVYLEECKYRVKNITITKFIEAELESESEPELEPELESDTE